jgi:hypothetical protein
MLAGVLFAPVKLSHLAIANADISKSSPYELHFAGCFLTNLLLILVVGKKSNGSSSILWV